MLTGALRHAVFDVAMAGLRAADPYAATLRCVTYDPASDVIEVDGRLYSLSPDARVVIVGAGKASHAIARALVDILGSRLSDGVVAVRDPDAGQLKPVRVIHSDHPLPSEVSVAAAEAILECVRGVGSEDVVLTCFTGGSSALACLPPSGVTLAEKRDLHRLLLGSGLTINDVNAVRKNVSQVKGGRLAAAAAPAYLVNLAVSDVAGSALDVMTDLVVQDTSTPQLAKKILCAAGLWDLVAESVRAHLLEEHRPVTVTPTPQTVVIVDGARTVDAMRVAALAAGFRPVVVAGEVEGEAEAVARRLCEQALSEAAVDQSPVMLLGCGGEAVVTLVDGDQFGAGGPNQECGLIAAELLRDRNAAAIFLDTDGSDGGTDYAGALIDGSTAAVAQELGIDLDAVVRTHQSSGACERLEAVVQLGHTGTNVNDLFAMAVAE